MRSRCVLAFAVLFFVGLAAGCASRPVQRTVAVPPRIDLRQHEVIGVVDFDSKTDGKLAPFATQRFVEWARRDQGIVRIVSLGNRKSALRSVEGGRSIDPETVRALGLKHGVRTIFTGELVVSGIRPRLQMLTSLSTGQVSAQVDATLAVQLLETETGASLWSATASGTREVGHLSVLGGGRYGFDANDPGGAYGDLVDALVSQATSDFRTSWERR